MVLLSPINTWFRAIRPRVTASWRIKSIFIPVFVAGFFIAYFQLLQHPKFPVTVMTPNGLDRLIAFQPAALLPYLTLWLYVFLAPALLCGRREIVGYSGEVAALTVVGLGAFFLWPTAVPPADFDATAHPMFAFLKSVDATGNACPSLHVAFAVFTAIWLARLLRTTSAPLSLQLLNASWCAAIVYSTLATKQHVAVDAFAGGAIGAAAALFDPVDPARAFHRPALWLNRQSLALSVSIVSKLTLFSLELDQKNPALALVLFLVPDIWILIGLLLPNAAGLMPTATRFQTTRREVWLTIDDGPGPATTGLMLDLLERHAASATFFLIGNRAAAHPELVTEIVRRGHSLGNHTHTHPLGTFWLAGPRRTGREIDACQAALKTAGGPAPDWFRAPAGIKTFFLRGALARHHLILIGWSTRAREHGSVSIDQPLRRLKNNLRPGAILLLHESRQHGAQRVALLAAFLDHLATTGYRCVLPERTDLR